MNFKNIIFYIFTLFVSVISKIICIFVYPIVFLFRKKINDFIKKRIELDPEHIVFTLKEGVKKQDLYSSILFWGFLFTTGLDETGIHRCCGPLWYKKEQKLKWFTDFLVLDKYDLNSNYPIPKTFKQKIQFFWLSYCWSGWRNACWALTEWFFMEGGCSWELTVHKSNMNDKTLDSTIMPSTSFKDIDGTDRNNEGPYIKYTFNTENEWECLQEGTKIVTFKTFKGKERFYYGKVKVYKLNRIKKFLVMELLFGWNPYNGLPTTASRFMFKKMDYFALKDYNKYLELY